MERIKIVIGTKVWDDAHSLERALSDMPEMQIVAGPTTASGVFSDATEMEADVVLLSPTLPGFRPELVSELLHFDAYPIASIGLLPPLESRTDELLALGMKGYVSLPLDAAQLRRLLELIPNAVTQARAERASSSYVPLDTPTLYTVAEAGWQRLVIALWGTGGGVGKTSLAINLAAALGVVAKRDTLLMDLDMTRGAIAPRLGLPAEHNIFALVNALLPDYLRTKNASCSPQALKAKVRLWGTKSASKLDCLSGIPAMHIAGQPVFRDDPQRTLGLIRAIIDTARKQYDFVVIDLGPDINNDVHFAALDAADLVLTVVRPDLADIHSTGQTVPRLKQTFGEDIGKFELVINQWSEEAGIRSKDLITSIGMKKFAQVPYDPLFTYANNQQRPFVLDKPNPTSDAIVSMAVRFFPLLAHTWVGRGGQIEGDAAAFKLPDRRKGPGLWQQVQQVFVGK
ncbi:MAG TPA: AAA family ATPase [Anaerolineae bacterium]|mgnify:CR=1 FL=1|nr:AAA family ATPase [Anaerolineae bacterium]HQI83391.1 AAA family ATPase [Anaerolineae bacterium]